MITSSRRLEEIARAAIGPCILAVLLAIFWIAALCVPGAIFIAVMVVVGTMPVSAFLGAAACVLVLIAFWRRNRLSAAMLPLAIAVVVLLARFPNLPESPLSWSANLIHVLVYRSDLQRQMADLRTKGVKYPVAAIDIDGFGSATTGIAYDPSGEIVLPPQRQSATWKRASEYSELSIDGLEARHIIGSYYSWYHP